MYNAEAILTVLGGGTLDGTRVGRLTRPRPRLASLKIALMILSVSAALVASYSIQLKAEIFPTVIPDPSEIIIDKPAGTLFTIVIWLDNGVATNTIDLNMYWEPYYLSLTDIQPGTCFPGGIFLIGAWNSEGGYINDVIYGIMGEYYNVLHGQAFICTFMVMHPGVTIIDLGLIHIYHPVDPPDVIYDNPNDCQVCIYENLIHPVGYASHTYYVKTRSTSTVSPIGFTETDRALNFNVTGLDGTSGCVNVTIPKDLVHVDPELPPYHWHVIIDDSFAAFTATENETHTFIYVEYAHSTRNISIIGYYLGSEEPDIEVYTTPPLKKTVIGKGFLLQINVIVRNWTIRTETFNVTLYVDAEPIVTFENVTLNRTQYVFLAEDYDTTEVPYGSYTIRATATTLLGETNTTNNELVYDVKVSIIGDFNGDYKVGPADFALLASAYGSSPGNPKWNPNCDVNGDWKVGSVDFAYLSAHFGQHYP